jgi:membrane protein DedA with SNARE-associated domain
MTMWNSIRALSWVCGIALVVWLMGMIGTWTMTDDWRILAMGTWIVGMATFFTAFFRARWIAARQRRSEPSAGVDS